MSASAARSPLTTTTWRISTNPSASSAACARRSAPIRRLSDRKRPCRERVQGQGHLAWTRTRRRMIDNSKCISCGACVYQCPFGAIMDKSYILNVIDLLKKSEQEQNYKALRRRCAFHFQPVHVCQARAGDHPALSSWASITVVEAALGADMVAHVRIEGAGREGLPYLAPAAPRSWTYIKQTFPQLAPYISHNLSPMATIAKYIKETDAERQDRFSSARARPRRWRSSSNTVQPVRRRGADV